MTRSISFIYPLLTKNYCLSRFQYFISFASTFENEYIKLERCLADRPFKFNNTRDRSISVRNFNLSFDLARDTSVRRAREFMGISRTKGNMPNKIKLFMDNYQKIELLSLKLFFFYSGDFGEIFQKKNFLTED